jgi:hypothetical protein
MPDCTQFEETVDRLREQIDERTALCQDIDDINEKKACLTSIGPLRAALGRAEQALRNCEAGLPPEGIQAARGRVTFLRVHDAGGFGPESDFLEGEVVFQLDTQPGRSFGFELREDAPLPAHEGMLGLLRDAFTNDLDVNINYRQVADKSNSVAFRIELRRSSFRPGSAAALS